MEFKSVTFQGGPITDKKTFDILPKDLQQFLEQINGIVAFEGGLQIYGCVKEPLWFSLGNACKQHQNLYDILTKADILFAQDCMGDQFMLRNNQVHYLNCETGEIDNLELSLNEFIKRAISNPVEFLSLYPLIQHMKNGNILQPGELLNVYPPFSMSAGPKQSYSIKNVPALEQRSFLADFYQQTKNLKDGERIQLKVI